MSSSIKTTNKSCISVLTIITISLVLQSTEGIKSRQFQLGLEKPLENDINKMIRKFVYEENPYQQHQNNDQQQQNDTNQDMEQPGENSTTVLEDLQLPVKQWKSITSENQLSMPARGGHSSLLYSSKHLKKLLKTTDDQFIVVFGGINDQDIRFNDIHVLSLPSFNWYDLGNITNITGLVPTQRAGHAAAFHGDKMLIFGGEDQQGNTNDLFTFDFTSFEWSRIEYTGEHPSQRSYQAFDYIPQNAIYPGSNPRLAIFGGYTDRGFSNEFFMFDLVTHHWYKPDLEILDKFMEYPRARQGASLIYALNKLWLFGGFQSGEFYNDLYSLDLKRMTWESLSTKLNGNLPSPRQMHMMSYVNTRSENNILGSLFISGGCNSFKKECYHDLYEVSFNDFWLHQIGKYQPYKNNYERHTLTTFGSNLIRIGGCDYEQEVCNGDVEAMNILDNNEQKDAIKENKMCKNGTITENDERGFIYCKCDQYHTGTDCSIKKTCPYDCYGNGQCLNSFECSCYPGFLGAYCDKQLDGCGTSNCSQEANGGTCYQYIDNIGVCECNEGRFGKFCQYSNSTSDEEIKAIEKKMKKQIKQNKLKKLQKNKQPKKQFLIQQDYNSSEILTNETLNVSNSSDSNGTDEQSNFTASNGTSNVTKKEDLSKENIFITHNHGNSLQNCKHECYMNGVCRNHKCFCEPNFSGEYCEINLIEYGTQGKSLESAIYYLYGGLGSGLIIGYAILRFFLNKSRQKEYFRFSKF